MLGIIVSAFFIAPALGVTDGLIVFLFPFGTFMQFCPLYFFGILFYYSFIDQKFEVADGNTSSKN